MSQDGYRETLKKEFNELIDLTELTDLQKRFLRGRWLDQVLWTEAKAPREQRRYYVLRVTAILGGVLVPALVSLDVGGPTESPVRWAAFAVGLVVAAAVALEGFFRFGERWRHYRRTAELLKMEGWQFFEQAGVYRGQKPSTAFASFAARTEAIMRQDVEGFISVIASDKPDEAGKSPATPPSPKPPDSA